MMACGQFNKQASVRKNSLNISHVSIIVVILESSGVSEINCPRDDNTETSMQCKLKALNIYHKQQ